MAKKKRANGYYSLNFKYDDRRYIVYAKRERDLAIKKAEKIQMIEEEKKYIEEHGGTHDNPSIEKYYERFLKEHRDNVKGNTIRAEKHWFSLVAETIIDGKRFGEFKLREVKTVDVVEVRDCLKKNGTGNSTINQCMVHLSQVFKDAVLIGLIERNPASGVRVNKRKNGDGVHDTTHRALSLKEQELFFQKAKEKNSFYLNAFDFMIHTGVRVGEMAALYPTDIDTKKGIVHIRRTSTRDEDGTAIIGDDTKTSSGVRDFPIDSSILRIIQRQCELNRMVFGFEAGVIFRRFDGGVLRAESINREIKRICEEIGIPVFTSHAFRNTFATRYIEHKPQNYKSLSKMMGHKDVSITLNLYTHVMEDSLISAMNGIEIKTI